MDHFFVSILLLEEGAIMGLSLLLVLAGAIVAANFFDVQMVFRRVTYFGSITALSLLLTVSQLLWVLTPAAADAGLITPLVIATMGSFIIFGAGVYFASAARSRHINGNSSSAWMGFIPILNFWLILKKGSASNTPTLPRRKVVRFVLDPILVFGGLFMLLITQSINKMSEGKSYFDPSESMALSVLMTNSQTLEQSFALQARLSKTDLPIRVDEITLLSNVEALGKTLRMTYDVEREITRFSPEFEKNVKQYQCAPDVFGVDIARGGKVETIYRAPSGKIIDRYETTKADCA